MRLEVPAVLPEFEVVLHRLELDHLDKQAEDAIIPFELFFKPAKNLNPETRKATLEVKVANAAQQLNISEEAFAETNTPAFLALVAAMCHQKVVLAAVNE